MAKPKDYVVLRDWDCGNAEISLSDVRTSLYISCLYPPLFFLHTNS